MFLKSPPAHSVVSIAYNAFCLRPAPQGIMRSSKTDLMNWEVARAAGLIAYALIELEKRIGKQNNNTHVNPQVGL